MMIMSHRPGHLFWIFESRGIFSTNEHMAEHPASHALQNCGVVLSGLIGYSLAAVGALTRSFDLSFRSPMLSAPPPIPPDT